MAKFYLTTAIDYANGEPHIGHAYEKIGADTIARYHRMRGDDVYFLTGLDEHGQKVAQAAAERGVSPQQFVDSIAGRFEDMWHRLSISYDRFMRTTGEDHKRGVRALIKRIHDASPDDFYEKSYEGWYCVGCELFKRRRRDRERPLHPAPDARAAVDDGAQLVLSTHALRAVSATVVRRASTVSRTRDAAQRDPLADRAGARGHLDHAIAIVVGDSLPAPTLERRRARHVGLVRRAAELSHGHRLSREALPRPLARAVARHRQGHHAAARGRLAGDAAGRRAAAAGARVGARVRVARR